MTPTPTPEPEHPSRQTSRRRTPIPGTRSGHCLPGIRSRTASLRSLRATRPTALWPFAEAEALPGTALLAGWLARTIVTLVTTYTRPGDRVLLLSPPAPTPTPSQAAGSASDRNPYAGLTEAVWAVTRLGRSTDTATAAPRLYTPGSSADSTTRRGAESVSGPRLSRPDRQPTSDPDRDRVPSGSGPGRSPRGRFDLIITAVEPRATDWLEHTDWAAESTPAGLVAIITHSDSYGDRLRDPLPVMMSALGNRGLRCIDRIVVLHAPISDSLPGASRGATATIDEPVRRRTSAGGTIDAPPLRRVHHDLVLFGRQPFLVLDAGASERAETSDV